jgi:hypothetical protein
MIPIEAAKHSSALDYRVTRYDLVDCALVKTAVVLLLQPLNSNSFVSGLDEWLLQREKAL